MIKPFFIQALINQIKMVLLKRAIKTCEKHGLMAVNVRQSDDGSLYIIAGSGTYVRFSKVRNK